jgi:proteic killer suppression protein
MEITFKTTKIARLCNFEKQAKKDLGGHRAAILSRRLTQLGAAPCLEVMRTLPGRTHELTGNLEETFSIDLDHPLRLLFEATPPPPRKPDGGIDWQQVTRITVVEILDTH